LRSVRYPEVVNSDATGPRRLSGFARLIRSIHASSSGREPTARNALGTSALVILAASLIGLFAGRVSSSSAAAAAGRQTLTIYSVATGVQFLNNADDIARGAANNPFNAATNKLRPKLTAKGNGPLAGDVTVYSFDLYNSASLRKSAGSASYTCYFNYANHALCMAYFELSGNSGTLVASGPVNFNSTHFTLVVTGGTKKYLAADGEVAAVPAAKNAQRLAFLLLG
jgi:hypothetical protein